MSDQAIAPPDIATQYDLSPGPDIAIPPDLQECPGHTIGVQGCPPANSFTCGCWKNGQPPTDLGPCYSLECDGPEDCQFAFCIISAIGEGTSCGGGNAGPPACHSDCDCYVYGGSHPHHCEPHGGLLSACECRNDQDCPVMAPHCVNQGF